MFCVVGGGGKEGGVGCKQQRWWGQAWDEGSGLLQSWHPEARGPSKIEPAAQRATPQNFGEFFEQVVQLCLALWLLGAVELYSPPPLSMCCLIVTCFSST